jgi:sugar/nucleoside kinase (ribokinase family)
MAGGERGVLCSGSIVFDTLVRPVEEQEWGTTRIVETIESHAGGNGANTSLALGVLGTPVRLLGAVGRDDHGAFLLRSLHAAGVDTSLVAYTEAPTAATIALVNGRGDRRFLHRLGSGTEAFATPIEFTAEVIAGMTHYHLASIFLMPNLRAQAAETLCRARTAGLTTSLDTNWDTAGRWMADLGPCLGALDFLFINEDEARMVTGSPDPAEAAGMLLREGVRTAVMKLGGRGCAVYTGDREILCPAYEVEAKDTTGAGDCFVAGFLSALLEGGSLADAGRLGNGVGAHVVQHVGGAEGVPSRAGLRHWMRTAKVRGDLV